MDLRIRCNNCEREMHFFEFMGYAEVYLVTAIGAVLAPFALKKLVDYLATPITTPPTKGLIDMPMATFARQFFIKCPDCGECFWQPASEPKTTTIFMKKKTSPKSTKKKEVSTSA